MGHQSQRIIFFGSGDFPRETFLTLIKTQSVSTHKVVGLVTSYDKCEDGGKTLKECAEKNDVPYITVKSCDDDKLREWCRQLEPTLFIVISFKKLPRELLSIVYGRAFNVHASILPFLKGANPIRWAIRNKMTSTGLTAITLSDEIDCGRIIDNTVVKIDKDDTYGTLKMKLSTVCGNFTHLVMDLFGDYSPIEQCDCGLSLKYFKAPKMNNSYFEIGYEEDLRDVLKSVLPYNGIKCKLVVREKVSDFRYVCGYSYKRIEEYDCTIWNLHYSDDISEQIITIDNTYPTLQIKHELDNFIIDEIQIAGKKRMNVKDFVNGFKYTKKCKQNEDHKYKVSIELYTKFRYIE